jgi:hypothetical protein
LILWTPLATDLSPLQGLPLQKLALNTGQLTDLSPLRGAMIEDLTLNCGRIKDVTSLLEMPKLERLRIAKLGKVLEPLRKHPTLKFLAYPFKDPYRPPAQFWAEFDAQYNSAARK